jgi:general secretion pathway protein H
MGRAASPEALAPRLRSRAPRNSGAMKRAAGFTLIEVVCALAIIALVAALVLPAIPRGTSRARLEAYALEVATLLTADRNAAIRRHAEVATVLDASGGAIHSGAGADRILLPRDVAFDALLASTCNGRKAGATIDFFPSGMSCGGTIQLRRGDIGFQVRVNWLTGGAEVVSLDTAAK